MQILNSHKLFLQAVKLPVCLCRRNAAPIILIENPFPLAHPNSKQGMKREKNCSEALVSDMETITCAIYINVNKLQYDSMSCF